MSPVTTRWLLLLLGPLLLRPAAATTAWVVDPLTRVRPKDPPRSTTEAVLKAARNESEAFQIVIRAGSKGVEGGTLEASDLKGDGGRVIERRHVALFREQYLMVSTPSPRSKEGPGIYPDALIPIQAEPGAKPPEKAPRFIGSPFLIPPEFNQPFWVEVHVPKDAAAGDYAGSITVSMKGEKPVVIPVTLTVWDFTLPDTPSLRTNFGGLGRRLLTGHPGYKPDTPPYRALERKYAEAMAAHRLCPPVPPYLRPKEGADGTVDPKESHAALKEWIEAFRLTGYEIKLIGEDPAGKDRERNVKMLRSTWAYLKENGWEKLAYVWALDEPNNDKMYEEVRRRAKMIHEAQPGLKVLCTEQPTPQDAAWGTLTGSVDIWVPLWTLFDEKAVAERQKAGEEVWSYTALCQGKAGGDAPYWEIDFPLLNYRIPAWTSRRYGLTGLLYWTVVYWTAGDVWANPLTYNRQYNGEGSLFYPGGDAGVEGPVASMRLKALRDGLEDYEYLALAGEAGLEKAVRMASSWGTWETKPWNLAAAREELAQIILAKKK
jgi:hypothetical protein